MPPSLARGVEEHSRPERLRQEERIARPRAALRPEAVRVHGADDCEPVLRLVVAQRVAAGEDPAGRAHLLVGGAEDRGERLVRQALREGGDREREERRAAHREDVVERVRRGDAPEERGVVDERREEVEREDERALVVELVDDGVVGGREPDEEVLGLGGHEAPQKLFEPGGGVLGGAAAARRERGEAFVMHSPRSVQTVRSRPQTDAKRPGRRNGGRGAAVALRERRSLGFAPRFAILTTTPLTFLK